MIDKSDEVVSSAFKEVKDMYDKGFEKKCILQEAIKIFEERGKEYGNVKDGFEIIAEYWTAFMRNKLKVHRHNLMEITKINPEDVPIMMILLKLSRETINQSRSNREDVAGYIKCKDEFHK